MQASAREDLVGLLIWRFGGLRFVYLIKMFDFLFSGFVTPWGICWGAFYLADDSHHYFAAIFSLSHGLTIVFQLLLWTLERNIFLLEFGFCVSMGFCQ